MIRLDGDTSAGHPSLRVVPAQAGTHNHRLL
jgi:hypothetical protein